MLIWSPVFVSLPGSQLLRYQALIFFTCDWPNPWAYWTWLPKKCWPWMILRISIHFSALCSEFWPHHKIWWAFVLNHTFLVHFASNLPTRSLSILFASSCCIQPTILLSHTKSALVSQHQLASSIFFSQKISTSQQIRLLSAKSCGRFDSPQV